MMLYYLKQIGDEWVLHKEGMVAISDDLTHDAAAVDVFQSLGITQAMKSVQVTIFLY